MKATQSIDLGLAVLSTIVRQNPRASFTLADIADVCECSRTAILNIERAALKKLGVRLRELQTRERM